MLEHRIPINEHARHIISEARQRIAQIEREIGTIAELLVRQAGGSLSRPWRVSEDGSELFSPETPGPPEVTTLPLPKGTNEQSLQPQTKSKTGQESAGGQTHRRGKRGL